MRRKNLIILASVAGGLLILLVILHRFQTGGPNGGASARRSVTIAQAGDFYLYAPLYIAQDRGFFAKNNVDVTIVSTGGDEKTWAAVISKSAQFGVADPTFIAVASERGQPGKIIATIVNGVPFWGITKKPAIPQITKPAELDSYTVATFPSPSTAYTLQRQMFVQGGLTPKIREGAFGTLLPLLEAGQADIALELEPNVSQAVQNGYRIVYSLADMYGDFTITGLCATPEYLSEDRQSAGAVVRAIREALDFLHNDPDTSADLLAKRFPEVKRDVAVAALRRALSSGVIPRSPQVGETAWRKALKLRVDAGDLKDDRGAMQFIDNSFAKQ